MDTIVPRMKTRLSVKVRLGLKSQEEIFRLLPVLNDYPLTSVTIHPRLGRQQYGGQPDMECFGRLLSLVQHPVVYNGDITTAEGARRIREAYPQVEDIMIGRGVLYRPTLPLDLKEPERSHDKDDTLTRQFIARLVEEIAERMPTEEARLRKTKEYWCLLWKATGTTETEARKVLHTNNFEEARKNIFAVI